MPDIVLSTLINLLIPPNNGVKQVLLFTSLTDKDTEYLSNLMIQLTRFESGFEPRFLSTSFNHVHSYLSNIYGTKSQLEELPKWIGRQGGDQRAIVC